MPTPRMKPLCHQCGDPYAPRRKAAGYTTCMPCGEELSLHARRSWTVTHLNKSGYMLITDPSILKQLNPKRTES
jgi:ribosomal protein L37AE/L43A